MAYPSTRRRSVSSALFDGDDDEPIMPNASIPTSRASTPPFSPPVAPKLESKPLVRRPYLLQALEKKGVRRVVRGLGWDVLGDTATLPFDGTMLTAADVSMALAREKECESRYDDFELTPKRADDEVRGLLWWSVAKAMEENVKDRHFKVDSACRDFGDLVECAYEQLVAECGHAVIQYRDGPHFTFLHHHEHEPASEIRARALRLLVRFAALGHPRTEIIISIPATPAGLDAARFLVADGVRVNLTHVASAALAGACALAGAAAVTMSVLPMHRWLTRTRAARHDAIHELQVAAAHFQAAGLETALVADDLRSVDDASALASLDIIVLGSESEARAARWHNAYPPLLLCPSESACARAEELAFNPDILAQRDGFRAYLSASEESTVAGVLGALLRVERHYATALRSAVTDELERQISALHGWLELPPPPPPPSPVRPGRKRMASVTLAAAPRKTKRARVDVLEVAKQVSVVVPPPAPSPEPHVDAREEYRLLAETRARDGGVSPRPARVSVRVLGGCGPQLETKRCVDSDRSAAAPFSDATNYNISCAGAVDEDEVF